MVYIASWIVRTLLHGNRMEDDLNCETHKADEDPGAYWPNGNSSGSLRHCACSWDDMQVRNQDAVGMQDF